MDANTVEGAKVVGSELALKETGGKTVFESTSKRPLDKRKRNKNDKPEDIEGFLGPWGTFVDEKRVMKPNEVQIIYKISLILKTLNSKCIFLLYFIFRMKLLS